MKKCLFSLFVMLLIICCATSKGPRSYRFYDGVPMAKSEISILTNTNSKNYGLRILEIDGRPEHLGRAFNEAFSDRGVHYYLELLPGPHTVSIIYYTENTTYYSNSTKTEYEFGNELIIPFNAEPGSVYSIKIDRNSIPYAKIVNITDDYDDILRQRQNTKNNSYWD